MLQADDMAVRLLVLILVLAAALALAAWRFRVRRRREAERLERGRRLVEAYREARELARRADAAGSRVAGLERRIR